MQTKLLHTTRLNERQRRLRPLFHGSASASSVLTLDQDNPLLAAGPIIVPLPEFVSRVLQELSKWMCFNPIT
jgi:hypothetical protein